MSSNLLLFFATFRASAVEAVEALTIVLAVGTVRGWRSTLNGVAAASVALAAIVAGRSHCRPNDRSGAPTTSRSVEIGITLNAGPSEARRTGR
ncbi:MAG TPA: hypothetical protein VFU10_06410 [Gaiellaceae bacterium]|nr:hypothetical protein [Gaiellaceae bacterium]